METKYDLKRLLRTGTLLALLLGWMLTGSFVANAQIAPMMTFNMDLTIVGSGTVTVSGYDNPIVGPVANSTVGPFADGSLLSITATAASGWTFVGWTGAVIGAPDATSNTIQVSGAVVPLTATFKKILVLQGVTVADKEFNGDDDATAQLNFAAATLAGIDPLAPAVNFDAAAAVGTFADAIVGTHEVTVTGVLLTGANANAYTLAPIVLQADITPKPITVTGALVEAKTYNKQNNAVIDITTNPAVLNGLEAGFTDVAINTASGTFANVNVGNWDVTVTVTLTGDDAGNYEVLPFDILAQPITAKELTITGLSVENKPYDGNTTATVLQWGVLQGIVTTPAPADVVNLVTGAATATFASSNVGSHTVTVAGLTLGGASAANYTLGAVTTTASITDPVYAIFNPTYNVGRNPDPVTAIQNVPIDATLSISFNADVTDFAGASLNGKDVGDFVKLEQWNTFTSDFDINIIIDPQSSMSNNTATIILSDPLEYGKQYRLRFNSVYKPNVSPAALVEYTLDYDDVNEDFLTTTPNALVAGNSVIFNTMTTAVAALPTVHPFGDEIDVCNPQIYVEFVNPVEYRNGTQLSDVPGGVRQKFVLESYDGINWVALPINKWNATATADAKRINFSFTDGVFEFNKQYRIRMTTNVDGLFGFRDKVLDEVVMGEELFFPHTGDFALPYAGWTWETTPLYDLKVDVSPWPNSPVFPTVPNPNNVTFKGMDVVNVGIAPGYVIAKDGDFEVDVTGTYPVTATPGEGYHFLGWRRSTDGGATYGSLLPTVAPLVDPQLGINYAPQTFNFDAGDLKPANCSQSIAYRADFAINKYTITASVNPVAPPVVGTVTGMVSNVNHGTTVTLTATPAPGQYLVNWDLSGLPPSVEATAVPNIPDHTDVGFSGQPGTVTFTIEGPISAGTFDVVANFAKFSPRIYAASEPADAGYINITANFAIDPIATGENFLFPGSTLPYMWKQYEAIGTEIKLENVQTECEYDFIGWFYYDVATPASPWKAFDPTTFFALNTNLRVKAMYGPKQNIIVTATSKEAANASVVVYYDAARTVPKVINGVPVNGGSTSYTYGTTLYITVFPEPEMKTWRWENAAGLLNTNVDFDGSEVDRTYWIYEVGSEPNCGGVDLKAVVELKEYEVTLETDNRTIGTINQSTPVAENGGNSSYPDQSELGFAFENPTPGTTQTGFGYFTIGTTVTMKATVVNPLYRFKHWEILGAPIPSVYTEEAEFTINGINADYGFEAVFELIPVPVPTYLLTVNVNGMGTTSMETGEIVAGVHTISATPAPGYYFVDWEASANLNVLPADLDNNPLTFTMPNEGATLTANFEKISYSVNPVVRTYLHPTSNFSVINYGGEFAPAGIQGPFEAGQTVTITAEEIPGFTFINWIDGQVDPLDPKILTGVEYTDNATIEFVVPATNDNVAAVVIDVYAIFIEEHLPAYPTYELTTATDPDGFGTVTGAGTYAHGIVVPVTQTPVPGTGYYFSGWDGNVVAGHVNMINGDEHVIAEYTPITYTLAVYSNNGNFGLIEINDKGEGIFDTKPFTVNDLPIMVTAIAEPQDCDNEYMFDGWYIDAAHTIRLKDAGGNDVLTESFNFIPFAHTTNVFEIYAKFSAEAREYDVTVVASPVEGGNPSIDVAGPYYCGDPLTITTDENEGYAFQHWTKDGVLFIEQRTFNYNVEEGGAEFVAVYEAIEYTVTATATAGGTVDPASQVKTIGEEVEVLAIANTGFEFTGWDDPDDVLADATANPATFNMPADDVSLEAQFTAIDYTVTATAGAGGTVAPATQTVNYQEEVTVVATPMNAGYLFNGWDDPDNVLANTMDNPAVFDMPDNDVTLHANFVAVPFVVSLTAAPANGGTFSAINATYTVGEAVSVTATANPGFIFNGWTGAPAGAVVTGNTIEFNMPAGNVSLTGNFLASSNKLMGTVAYFNQFASKIPASANVKVALYEGAVLVGGPVTVGASGDFEFTGIVPGTDYTVKVWEDANVANSWSYNNWGGVNATDALVISYMIAQNTTVENFAWIAPVTATALTDFAVATADVSNDGSLTSADPLIAMRRAIGMPGYAPYPGGAPNFQVAGGADYPQAPGTVFTPNGVYAAGTMAGDFFYTADVVGAAGETTFNIYFVATGDINATYVPQAGAKAQMALNYNEVINVAVGDEVRIPVRIDQASQLGAVTMGLNFNNSLLEVTSVEGFDNVAIDNANGTIRMAWMDLNTRNVAANEAIVMVNARILAPVTASTEFFMLDGATEVVDAMAKPIDVSFTTVSIETGAATINEVAELVSAAYPNPFNNEATIAYTLPEAGKVNVVVYNKLGQQVVTLVNEAQVAGQHTVRLNSSDLNGNGAYYYMINVEGAARTYTVNGTLILVK